MEKIFNKPPRFYYFTSKSYYNTFHVNSEIFIEAVRTDDSSERRHVDHYLMSGEYPEWIKLPVVFHWIRGNKLRDILDWATDPYLVSDRLVELLEENHVTGWKTYPVEIYDKKMNRIPGYQGFSVTGRGGCVKDGKYKLSDWDGSEIFMIGRGSQYVTERVKTLFEENKIDGALFKPFSYEII